MNSGKNSWESQPRITLMAQRGIAATKEDKPTTDEHEWTQMGREAGKRMIFSVGAPAGRAKSGRNKQPPRSVSAATGRKGGGNRDFWRDSLSAVAESPDRSG